jgi:hypothetical protein
MGLREQLRNLRRQMHGDMDYLTLTDGSKYYFDPEQVSQDLFFEMLEKGYLSKPGTASEVETPKIRAALVRATPESLSRFEEKYLPVTRETGVVHSEDRQTVRRIELDGTVRSFLVEGEPARELLADLRAGRTESPPLDTNRPGIREIDPEKEPELLEVEDLSE